MIFRRLVIKQGKIVGVKSEGTKLVDSNNNELIMFHNKDERKWYLINEYTGLSVCHGKTKKECIEVYKERYEERYNEYLKSDRHSTRNDYYHTLLKEGE